MHFGWLAGSASVERTIVKAPSAGSASALVATLSAFGAGRVRVPEEPPDQKSPCAVASALLERSPAAFQCPTEEPDALRATRHNPNSPQAGRSAGRRS